MCGRKGTVVAKKKLSRDQKRKQKKQKRKQRKQKNVSAGPSWSNLKINQMTPEEQEAQIAEGQARYAEQEQRIKAIFGLPEIPEVNASTLLTYFHYIGDKLAVPCLLTGIESMGYFGWEEYAPFDAIIVTAAPDHLPQPLVLQMADDSRLVIPIGPVGAYQELWLYSKEGGELQPAVSLGGVRFVPFTRQSDATE